MLLLLKSAVFPGSSPALLSVCFLSPESLQLFKTCRQQTMRHNHTVKTIWKEGAAQESKVKFKKKKKHTQNKTTSITSPRAVRFLSQLHASRLSSGDAAGCTETRTPESSTLPSVSTSPPQSQAWVQALPCPRSQNCNQDSKEFSVRNTLSSSVQSFCSCLNEHVKTHNHLGLLSEGLGFACCNLNTNILQNYLLRIHLWASSPTWDQFLLLTVNPWTDTCHFGSLLCYSGKRFVAPMPGKISVGLRCHAAFLSALKVLSKVKVSHFKKGQPALKTFLRCLGKQWKFVFSHPCFLFGSSHPYHHKEKEKWETTESRIIDDFIKAASMPPQQNIKDESIPPGP